MKKKNKCFNEYDELSQNRDNSSYLYYGENNNHKEKKSADKKWDRKNKNISSRVYALNSLYISLIFAALIVVIILGLRSYVIAHAVVDGQSMQNTLMDNDHIMFEKLTYRDEDPKRFDIIVFRPYEDDPDCFYVKRVIGLPGEKVRIENNNIFINDKQIVENYGGDNVTDAGIAATDILLGKDEFFVLGDNRTISLDSRDSKVGNVKRSAIQGRVIVDIWPLENARFLFDN